MLTQYNIQSDLNDPSTYYFISAMTDRLEYANQRWAKVLQKRFGKKFKPIYIVSSVHDAEFMQGDDHIVLAQDAKVPNDDEAHILATEDVNEIMCGDAGMKELFTALADKQGKLFVLLFNTALFHSSDPRVMLLGADPLVTRQFDGKPEHLSLFKELGILPQKIQIFANFADIRANLTTFPSFVTASFSSTGSEAMRVNEPADLDALGRKLRPLNKMSRFVASELITDIVIMPNVSALAVDENDIRIVCITDQVTDEHRYLGNVSPSSITDDQQQKIREMVVKVGRHMASRGFRGLFGMDVLINATGVIFPSDLNPRRQGTYIPSILMSKHIDLVEQECRLFLGEPLDDFTEADLQYDFAWSCSRLPGAGVRTPFNIVKSAYESSPQETFASPGGKHWAVYYPAGATVTKGSPGLYIATHKDRSALAEQMAADVTRLTNELFST